MRKLTLQFFPIDPMLIFLTPQKKSFFYSNFLAHTSLQLMKTTLRKMYARIEEKIRNKYWEIKIYKKFKILQKRKQFLVIVTQGIFPPIWKTIRILVAELQMLTDGWTDRPTDRRHTISCCISRCCVIPINRRWPSFLTRHSGMFQMNNLAFVGGC